MRVKSAKLDEMTKKPLTSHSNYRSNLKTSQSLVKRKHMKED